MKLKNSRNIVSNELNYYYYMLFYKAQFLNFLHFIQYINIYANANYVDEYVYDILYIYRY